ncbi:hypothetical protein HK097_001058 [Rhizophlyctis rosea]|uniref:Phosphoenolpyruvate/pyruvate domain-containing protein n=1 Tax=Rhizophlyctis rosea TaxID=64517 RepID=A0AAD5X3K3_9FUNG|nr:hypothetical protein HK097_001058 [Rhizophlyctis rosea]
MSPLAFPEQPALATKLKSLHKPGDPVVLTNVHDPPTAALLLSQSTLPKAVATPSYAIAAINGLEDDELTFDLNLRSIELVAGTLRKKGYHLQIPLTADLQNGYGSSLESVISESIAAGVVGCNLEDAYHPDGNIQTPTDLYPIEEQCSRIRRVLSVAQQAGVPDFCVNARTDALYIDRSLEEAIERGKAYLEAGATSVFVWGGPKRGVSREEVVRLVEAFEGRLNVKMNCVEDGGLQKEELAKIGVSRISLGPTLWRVGMAAIGKTVEGLAVDGVLRRL